MPSSRPSSPCPCPTGALPTALPVPPPDQALQFSRSPKTKPQGTQLYLWSMTVHETKTTPDLTSKISSMTKALKSVCKDYIFQLEKAPTTGRLHYQGYLKLHTKLRKRQLIGKIASYGFPDASFQPCSTAGRKALEEYAMKEESRVQGPFSMRRIYLGQDLITVLRPWQKEIAKMLLGDASPHRRKIFWYHDQAGGAGKSSFSKYMWFHHKVLTLTFADAKDLLNLVSKMPGLPAYIFDLSRTKGGKTSMSDIYQALESVKNGYFINSKYETSVVCFEIPHVIVFSNHLPDVTALSMDRWDIRPVASIVAPPFARAAASAVHDPILEERPHPMVLDKHDMPFI